MKYKNGDKVKIKDWGYSEDDMRGVIGIVDDISEEPNDTCPYKVSVGIDYDWFKESDLELFKGVKIVYVISSHEFTTLEQVKKQLGKWMDEGTLSTDAKVYKIEKEIPYEIKKEVKFR